MRWRIALPVALLAVLLFASVLVPRIRAHRRASDVLHRFAASAAASAGSATPAIDVTDEHEAGVLHLRWYIPRDVAAPPALVLVHGIHRLAVEEPRLVRFARALAASGIAVVTPEVRELADYRVDVRSIDTIGEAARAAHQKTGRKAGIMGMSFAGGLALLAACDPRFANDIAMVVAVGAHHDVARVTRFYATNRIERTDGTGATFAAHPYGALVFVHAHAERFFSAADLVGARQALSSWLAEDRDAARATARALTEPAADLLQRLFDQRFGEVGAAMLAAATEDAAALSLVSPRGRLERLAVPVFLLHGAGDAVIPFTETEWLAADVPPGVLRDVLVSKALVHVEPGGQATWYEQWELLHFMAEILSELDVASR
jgi:pimeloyl-ACP methyl ester carboxylesterase